MPHARAMRRAREASICDERHGFAQSRADDVARRREHLLHAGTALRAFIADHHHVPRLHLAAQDARARLFLRIEADGLAREAHHRGRHAAFLHHRAAFGQVAPQHGEAAILRIGVADRADHVVVRNLRCRDLLEQRLPAHRRRIDQPAILHLSVFTFHSL